MSPEELIKQTVTVNEAARLTGQMSSTGRPAHVIERPRPYADVPFEQLEAVVAKLDELEEK